MVINSVSSNNKNLNNKAVTQQKASCYVVKAGDNLTQIAKKYNMTAKEFKAWTGLKTDSIQINQKINLPQAKVPEGKGIYTLANKYNMDFNKFCELNNIPKPYNEYSPKKDETFYVCKDFGKTKLQETFGTDKPKETSTKTTKTTTQTKKTTTTTKTNTNNTVKYQGKLYNKCTVPTCGYTEAIGGTHSVSHPGGSYPSVPVDSNGNIVAEIIKFKPSAKGKLSGKTIMVNAGHGWGYYNNNPMFDIGTSANDKNGKKLEEWNKNRNYADNLIASLCAKGATVIYTTGKAQQVCDAKKKYSADMLISLHCNASKNTNTEGLQVFYSANKSDGKNLAKCVKDKFQKNINSNTIVKSDGETRHGRIGIIGVHSKGKQIPSILIEMGYMSNTKDILNIDSKTHRQKAMDQVTEAVISYWGL